MNSSVLGIDFGTSSVKVLQKFRDNSVKKYKKEYKRKDRKGWWDAILSIFGEINFENVAAIGLASQVGTYLVNDKEIIHWNQAEGKEELQELLEKYSSTVFRDELGMVHPRLNSYPLPRLLYCKRTYGKISKLCQLKDEICEKLTGEYVTDPYSWRGLINREKMVYSPFFLKEMGIEEKVLPKIKNYNQMVGLTREIPLTKGKLPQGIPVYLGLNDFFSSLVGMGFGHKDTLFDVTGTSEHLGIITEELPLQTNLIAGPYLKNYLHYGVTACGGDSIKMALKLKTNRKVEKEEFLQKGPVFLPYLKGERAPIFDPDARGCFFGVETGDEDLLFYSVMEGVVFSLYHIYETLGSPQINRIIVSGGASEFSHLNQLKAEIFGVKVDIVEETETTALGAAMIAAVESEWFKNIEEAQKSWCRIKQQIIPTGRSKALLKKRYSIYKKLYPALKPLYHEWNELKK